jgi:hypothetical protein
MLVVRRIDQPLVPLVHLVPLVPLALLVAAACTATTEPVVSGTVHVPADELLATRVVESGVTYLEFVVPISVENTGSRGFRTDANARLAIVHASSGVYLPGGGSNESEDAEQTVTESVDQALVILGIVFPQRFGAAGGFAKPVNFQVFSGIPALGEEYRHEIAHVVLLPILRGGGPSVLASEGVPTLFGGTAGRGYQASVRRMDSLLVAQPEISLETTLDDMSVPADIRNAAGAVLADMVHDAGGVAAVREYLRTPGRGIREFLVRLLARPWPEVSTAWREHARRIATT